MSHGHERVVCSCGAVIMQCRCMGPKATRVVRDGCAACRKSAMTGTTNQCINPGYLPATATTSPGAGIELRRQVID